MPDRKTIQETAENVLENASVQAKKVTASACVRTLAYISESVPMYSDIINTYMMSPCDYLA